MMSDFLPLGVELLLRDTTCALVAAIYADQGIAAVSAFAGEHVFPPLMKLRETVDLVQPGNALECLNAVLKAAHLLPHYRTKQVLHEGTENAEYVVGLLIGGMEMATGQGTTTQAAKSSAARAALRNSALVALLPASAKAKVPFPRFLPFVCLFSFFCSFACLLACLNLFHSCMFRLCLFVCHSAGGRLFEQCGGACAAWGAAGAGRRRTATPNFADPWR